MLRRTARRTRWAGRRSSGPARVEAGEVAVVGHHGHVHVDPLAVREADGQRDQVAGAEGAADRDAAVVGRLRAPPRWIVRGGKSRNFSTVPARRDQDSKSTDFCWSLLDSEAMKVPEPAWPDTTTAPSTSTSPSRLLAPVAGV